MRTVERKLSLPNPQPVAIAQAGTIDSLIVHETAVATFLISKPPAILLAGNVRMNSRTVAVDHRNFTIRASTDLIIQAGFQQKTGPSPRPARQR
jgi:hypothetical protein